MDQPRVLSMKTQVCHEAETVKVVNQQVLHPSTLAVRKDLKVVLDFQFAMLKNYV